MSFVSFGSFLSSGSSINPSIAWARGKRGEGRFRITLPLDPAWYKEQPCTRFRSLQHRKERNGFQHEFIVLKLENKSICRIERMGDPDASFDAISNQGIAAHDIAQSFPLDKLPDAHLDTSDVVTEITFPLSLDLGMVLLICRAMQEGEKTCNYTLQVFNCYFFSLAIQAALTRLVADWETPAMFWDVTWHSAIGRGLSALSDFYKKARSIQEQQPFILRIHSALRPDTQWPAEDLMCKLQQELRQLMQGSQVCDGVLWLSDMGLAVDRVLCGKVREVAVDILKAKTQSEDLLLELVSQAISTHEQELRVSKLNRVHQSVQQKGNLQSFLSRSGVQLVGGYTLEFLPGLQSRSNPPQPHPDLPQLHPDPLQLHLDLSRPQPDPPQPQPNIPRLRPDPPLPRSDLPRLRLGTPWLVSLPLSRVSQLSVWLTYAKKLVLWTLQVVLGLFWIDLLGSAQPTLCVFIEDELEPSLAILQVPKCRNEHETILMSQKLRSLIATPQLVLWKEWPWHHVYKPIRQHVLESLPKEKTVLRVSFSNAAGQTTSISEFQNHLLERIRDHAARVQSFKLGSAARVQDEMKDRMSQVWDLIRSDDISLGFTIPHLPYTGILGGLSNNLGAGIANFGNGQGAALDALIRGGFNAAGVMSSELLPSPIPSWQMGQGPIPAQVPVPPPPHQG